MENGFLRPLPHSPRRSPAARLANVSSLIAPKPTPAVARRLDVDERARPSLEFHAIPGHEWLSVVSDAADLYDLNVMAPEADHRMVYESRAEYHERLLVAAFLLGLTKSC